MSKDVDLRQTEVLNAPKDWERKNKTEFIVKPQDLKQHEDIRSVFKWGTYGPNGDRELEYIYLKDLSSDHIYNIFMTQNLTLSQQDTFFTEIYWRLSGR